MGFDAWIGPVIIAAAIAAMVNVLGWIVSSRREIRAQDRRRAEKQADIATALLAEVTHYYEALAFFDLDDVWADVVGAMEADDSYLPFIPSERNDTIFRAIVGDIHILPEDVIMPVTRYYNQVFAIEAIIEDLRSDTLRGAPQSKRIAVYTDYISLKKEALVAGKAAVHALKAATPGSVPGARTRLAGGRGAR